MPDIFVAQPPEKPEKTKEEVKVASETPVETAVEKGEGNSIPPPPQTQKGVEQTSFRPWAALMANPRGVNFQDQDEEEEIIILLRKHWVTNLPWILIGSLMFVVPLLISFLFSLANFSLEAPLTVLSVAIIFWYLISFGYLFINFLIWYFNAHIVTNKRIVDIDFHDLVYKEVSTTQLEKMQDVTFKMGGVIRHIFNYGDIFIQTAGTEPNFDFLAVPKPEWVVHKLGELMEQTEAKASEP